MTTTERMSRKDGGPRAGKKAGSSERIPSRTRSLSRSRPQTISFDLPKLPPIQGDKSTQKANAKNPQNQKQSRKDQQGQQKKEPDKDTGQPVKRKLRPRRYRGNKSRSQSGGDASADASAVTRKENPKRQARSASSERPVSILRNGKSPGGDRRGGSLKSATSTQSLNLDAEGNVKRRFRTRSRSVKERRYDAAHAYALRQLATEGVVVPARYTQKHTVRQMTGDGQVELTFLGTATIDSSQYLVYAPSESVTHVNLPQIVLTGRQGCVLRNVLGTNMLFSPNFEDRTNLKKTSPLTFLFDVFAGMSQKLKSEHAQELSKVMIVDAGNPVPQAVRKILRRGLSTLAASFVESGKDSWIEFFEHQEFETAKVALAAFEEDQKKPAGPPAEEPKEQRPQNQGGKYLPKNATYSAAMGNVVDPGRVIGVLVRMPLADSKMSLAALFKSSMISISMDDTCFTSERMLYVKRNVKDKVEFVAEGESFSPIDVLKAPHAYTAIKVGPEPPPVFPLQLAEPLNPAKPYLHMEDGIYEMSVETEPDTSRVRDGVGAGTAVLQGEKFLGLTDSISRGHEDLTVQMTAMTLKDEGSDVAYETKSFKATKVSSPKFFPKSLWSVATMMFVALACLAVPGQTEKPQSRELDLQMMNLRKLVDGFVSSTSPVLDEAELLGKSEERTKALMDAADNFLELLKPVLEGLNQNLGENDAGAMLDLFEIFATIVNVTDRIAAYDNPDFVPEDAATRPRVQRSVDEESRGGLLDDVLAEFDSLPSSQQWLNPGPPPPSGIRISYSVRGPSQVSQTNATTTQQSATTQRPPTESTITTPVSSSEASTQTASPSLSASTVNSTTMMTSSIPSTTGTFSTLPSTRPTLGQSLVGRPLYHPIMNGSGFSFFHKDVYELRDFPLSDLNQTMRGCFMINTTLGELCVVKCGKSLCFGSKTPPAKIKIEASDFGICNGTNKIRVYARQKKYLLEHTCLDGDRVLMDTAFGPELIPLDESYGVCWSKNSTHCLSRLTDRAIRPLDDFPVPSPAPPSSPPPPAPVDATLLFFPILKDRTGRYLMLNERDHVLWIQNRRVMSSLQTDTIDFAIRFAYPQSTRVACPGNPVIMRAAEQLDAHFQTEYRLMMKQLENAIQFGHSLESDAQIRSPRFSLGGFFSHASCALGSLLGSGCDKSSDSGGKDYGPAISSLQSATSALNDRVTSLQTVTDNLQDQVTSLSDLVMRTNVGVQRQLDHLASGVEVGFGLIEQVQKDLYCLTTNWATFSFVQSVLKSLSSDVVRLIGIIGRGNAGVLTSLSPADMGFLGRFKLQNGEHIDLENCFLRTTRFLIEDVPRRPDRSYADYFKPPEASKNATVSLVMSCLRPTSMAYAYYPKTLRTYTTCDRMVRTHPDIGKYALIMDDIRHLPCSGQVTVDGGSYDLGPHGPAEAVSALGCASARGRLVLKSDLETCLTTSAAFYCLTDSIPTQDSLFLSDGSMFPFAVHGHTNSTAQDVVSEVISGVLFLSDELFMTAMPGKVNIPGVYVSQTPSMTVFHRGCNQNQATFSATCPVVLGTTYASTVIPWPHSCFNHSVETLPSPALLEYNRVRTKTEDLVIEVLANLTQEKRQQIENFMAVQHDLQNVTDQAVAVYAKSFENLTHQFNRLQSNITKAGLFVGSKIAQSEEEAKHAKSVKGPCDCFVISAAGDFAIGAVGAALGLSGTAIGAFALYRVLGMASAQLPTIAPDTRGIFDDVFSPITDVTSGISTIIWVVVGVVAFLFVGCLICLCCKAKSLASDPEKRAVVLSTVGAVAPMAGPRGQAVAAVANKLAESTPTEEKSSKGGAEMPTVGVAASFAGSELRSRRTLIALILPTLFVHVVAEETLTGDLAGTAGVYALLGVMGCVVLTMLGATVYSCSNNCARGKNCLFVFALVLVLLYMTLLVAFIALRQTGFARDLISPEGVGELFVIGALGLFVASWTLLCVFARLERVSSLSLNSSIFVEGPADARDYSLFAVFSVQMVMLVIIVALAGLVCTTLRRIWVRLSKAFEELRCSQKVEKVTRKSRSRSPSPVSLSSVSLFSVCLISLCVPGQGRSVANFTRSLMSPRYHLEANETLSGVCYELWHTPFISVVALSCTFALVLVGFLCVLLYMFSLRRIPQDWEVSPSTRVRSFFGCHDIPFAVKANGIVANAPMREHEEVVSQSALFMIGWVKDPSLIGRVLLPPVGEHTATVTGGTGMGYVAANLRGVYPCKNCSVSSFSQKVYWYVDGTMHEKAVKVKAFKNSVSDEIMKSVKQEDRSRIDRERVKVSTGIGDGTEFRTKEGEIRKDLTDDELSALGVRATGLGFPMFARVDRLRSGIDNDTAQVHRFFRALEAETQI